MTTRDDAITYARSLCYLRSAAKIQMHVRNDLGFNLSRETIGQILAEYESSQRERRSFKPQPTESQDVDLAGRRMIESWRRSSADMATALSRYQGKAAA